MLWMVGLTVLILLSFLPVLVLLHALAPAAGPFFVSLADGIASVVALAGYIAAVRLVEKRLPTELQPRYAIPEIFIGVASGTLLFGSVMAILVASGSYQVTWLGAAPAWRAAGLSVRAGIVEEIVFRGILLRLLWSAFGLRAALAVSAGLFGAIHLLNPGTTLLSALSIALEAGIMLGAFYALTGRLWLSMGVHGAWNFAQSYLFGAAVSGQDLGPALARSVPDSGTATWITGGSFGPEASLVALLICGAIGGTALMVSRNLPAKA